MANPPRTSSNRRVTGATGEALAAQYLIAAGYTLEIQGWRCAIGEIDWVARQGADWVFIEVRTRRGAELGAALESIGKRKQDRMIRLAQAYLTEHHLEDAAWRIDVVAVSLSPNAPAQIEIIENAVGW